jgi:hypothetical protein
MTTKTPAPRTARLLGALATVALILGPGPAVASAATDHPVPPRPPSGGKRAEPVALAPDRLRLRADRPQAGSGLSLR